MQRPERNHVVFTDIDGTLLDAETFDFTPARPVLQRLHRIGVPVVPVTSMTLEEMEPIARELGIRHAMIIESGGGIARWTAAGWEVERCGPEPDAMLEIVREIEDRSGAELTVYSVLPDHEAARLSGLSGEMLHRSTCRRFSEPFVIANGEMADVIEAAAAIGFSMRRGRRFFHLSPQRDEGAAYLRLREELRCQIAVALGDSPLDAEFLTRAEVPIIIPQPDGLPDRELLSKVPNALLAPAPGSAGWAAAVNDVMVDVFALKRSARGFVASLICV